jgi:CHAT domain-containing protein
LPPSPNAQALQAAQRAFTKGRVRLSGNSGDAAHPYFWAAYVLMGNPR